MSDSVIFNRLKKNWLRLGSWSKKNQIEAFRLYDRDIPEYPFLIDIYGQSILLYDRRENIDFEVKKTSRFEETVEAVQRVTGLSSLIIKRRERQRVEDKSQQYEKLSDENKVFSIKEGEAQFWVNLTDYLDTGLFLDHRFLRQKILKMCRPDMNFLNLFSYTGSVSVFAAMAGATTTSVDLSRTYTEWAKKNFALNGLDVEQHEFVESGVIEFLQDKSRQEYDLIFLDPPTFSNSKKTESDFEVERDQVDLVELSMDNLKEGGLLIFSNNKRSFRLDPSIREKFDVKEVSHQTLPFDFRDENLRHVFEIRRK